MGELFVVLIGLGVDPGKQLGLSGMSLEHGLHRVGDLAHGGSRPGSFNAGGQQVASANRGFGDGSEGRFSGAFVTPGTDLLQTTHLLLADLGVVDIEHVDQFAISGSVFVDTNDRILASIDAHLAQRRCLLDAQLRRPRSDCLCHTPGRFDLSDDLAGTLG